MRSNEPIVKIKVKSARLRAGDWVEVRSKDEILRTLDAEGRLDGMPFMPEMFAFCGKRFRVYKRAHKTCDTVFPVRGRRVDRAVHLETRCDGSAHGGCQASCLIFWKDAWLKTVNENPPEGVVVNAEANSAPPNAGPSVSKYPESEVWTRSQVAGGDKVDPTYTCQATQLPYATTHLAWWDFRQYVEDYWSGNVTLWRMICGGVYILYCSICRAGIGLGPAMRWFYDKFYPLWGGTPFPRMSGTIPSGQVTPLETLNLQPGELVRVKSHDEILRTLDTNGRNRGLYFDAEEVPYCGGSYRVLKLVTRIINEQTGKMQEFKIPSVILDSVVCQARFSACRLFCPRSIYAFWRETWLERVGFGPSAPR
jgi:hypothetical protein